MTVRCSGFRFVTTAVFAMVIIATGCTSEDTRLVDDAQSCRTMGHVLGSASYDECMKDLNTRRCATVAVKGGTRHDVTANCTRL